MSTMVTMAEAQAQLPKLVAELSQGEEIIITENLRPVATIRATPASTPSSREPPKLGTLKGTILYIAPDFDAIPEGFEEYVP